MFSLTEYRAQNILNDINFVDVRMALAQCLLLKFEAL